MGQQLTMTDQRGTTTNSYDALGRVLSETNGRGNTLNYEYDKAGRRVAMVDPESGRTTYSYADNGWLTQLKDPQNGVTVYAYDKLGRELTKTLPNGVKATHVYNEVGYETLLEERDASGTLLSRYATTHNKVGMKMSVTEKDGSSVNYRYYLTYELAREERVGNGAYLIEYFYDAAGNHLRTVRDGVETTTYCDVANQITRKVGPNGTVNFVYDADGNLSSETAPDGSGKSYSFDGRDQLVAVEMKSAGGALFHRSEFAYDAMGRLVKSAEFERNGTSWVKQSERGRVLDGMDTVQERGESNQVLAQLTRDGNIGGILSRKAGASAAFFGYDGNGNVTTLSDAQGNSVGHYRYDGFGNALDVSGSVAQENAHRFSTKELHAPSGLYYYGFRFYSPALGRWINRDPIGEAGGVNLYQTVGNNPVNLLDPHGLRDPDEGSYKGPYPSTSPPSELSCSEKCLIQVAIGVSLATGAIGSGLPTKKKPFKTKSASSRTSPISEALSKKFPKSLDTIRRGFATKNPRLAKIIPSKIWAPTWKRPGAMSNKVGRVAGRWVPIAGWILLFVDANEFKNCYLKCEDEKLERELESNACYK